MSLYGINWKWYPTSISKKWDLKVGSNENKCNRNATTKQNIKRLETHQNAEGDLNAKGLERVCLVYRTDVYVLYTASLLLIIYVVGIT